MNRIEWLKNDEIHELRKLTSYNRNKYERERDRYTRFSYGYHYNNGRKSFWGDTLIMLNNGKTPTEIISFFERVDVPTLMKDPYHGHKKGVLMELSRFKQMSIIRKWI